MKKKALLKTFDKSQNFKGKIVKGKIFTHYKCPVCDNKISIKKDVFCNKCGVELFKTTIPDILRRPSLAENPDSITLKVFFAYEDDRLSYIHNFSGPEGLKELTRKICLEENLYPEEIIEEVYNEVMHILDEIAIKKDEDYIKYINLYQRNIQCRLENLLIDVYVRDGETPFWCPRKDNEKEQTN